MTDQKFRLRHVTKNFPARTDEYSKEEVHYGVPWSLHFVRKDDFLAVYLRCEKENDEKNPWSIEAYFKISLFSITRKDPLLKEGTYKFECKQGYGFPQFHPWDDVVKNHMIDNTVVVECDVTIKTMTGMAEKRMISFDEPKENLTDVVLKIGERKFHVSKVALAIQSTYFEAMFFRDFKESKSLEVVLNDVDATDFQVFLEIVYGYSEVTEETVEGILKLADQFDAASVRKKCERFLQHSVQMDKRKRLRLADSYNFENLKRNCLDSIKTTDELRQFLPNDLEKLSHATLVAVLQQNLTQN